MRILAGWKSAMAQSKYEKMHFKYTMTFEIFEKYNQK